MTSKQKTITLQAIEISLQLMLELIQDSKKSNKARPGAPAASQSKIMALPFRAA